MSFSILMLHNRYLRRGGEDVSTANEAELLRRGGHNVDLVEYDNADAGNLATMCTALSAVWSPAAMRDIRGRLAEGRYDLLHVQNYFPRISPAVLRVAASLGIPAVQALRNYRLICANAQFFRNGQVCTDCLRCFAPWRGVMHGCYRDSRAASAAVTAMIATHKIAGTWSRHTAAFIAVSEYVRQAYIAAGFPAERIFAKPNVVAKAARTGMAPGQQIAYIGRLSPEKGLESLIYAWRRAGRPGRLIIAGDGPSANALRTMQNGDETIHFTGQVGPQEAVALMAASKAIVIPSLWGEPFPRTGVEALSVGTPVFGAASGGIVELVGDGRAGAAYPAGDANALAALVARLFSDAAWAVGLRNEARSVFAERYAPDEVLQRTEAIYRWALARSGNAPAALPAADTSAVYQ